MNTFLPIIRVITRYTQRGTGHLLSVWSVVALATSIPAILCISACNRAHSRAAQYEYAELREITETAIGSGPRPEIELTVVFESDKSVKTSRSHAGLIKELGGKPPGNDCSTSVLNLISSEGWELLTHSTSEAFTSFSSQGAGYGGTVMTIHRAQDAWTFRREK